MSTYIDAVPGASQYDEAWPASPAIALGALQRHHPGPGSGLGDRPDYGPPPRTQQFDRSMIIITSDRHHLHAWASPRQPMEDRADILYVPLHQIPGTTARVVTPMSNSLTCCPRSPESWEYRPRRE